MLSRYHRDTSDGGYPQAGVMIDRMGRVCGTTLNGGPGAYGTAFCLTPPSEESGSWKQTILYGFEDNNQYGADPVGGLSLGGEWKSIRDGERVWRIFWNSFRAKTQGS
jgi:hypothetical protein